MESCSVQVEHPQTHRPSLQQLQYSELMAARNRQRCPAARHLHSGCTGRKRTTVGTGGGPCPAGAAPPAPVPATDASAPADSAPGCRGCSTHPTCTSAVAESQMWPAGHRASGPASHTWPGDRRRWRRRHGVSDSRGSRHARPNVGSSIVGKTSERTSWAACVADRKEAQAAMRPLSVATTEGAKMTAVRRPANLGGRPAALPKPRRARA